MEQTTKLYWPQYKVFFIGTLVLFPDRLTAQPLDPWFFSPYFNFLYDKDFNKDDPDLTWAAVVLDEYKKDGYIKYERVDGLFKITSINTAKAEKDLTQYLKRWQRNELLTLKASKPPDATRQDELLLAAIVHAYPDQKSVQRITLEDIYGKSGDYTYNPPFWELVLANQLLDKKIKITYMDYDRRDDGLYENDVQPVVDVKVVGTKLAGSVQQELTRVVKPVSPTVPASIVTATPENTPTKQEGRVMKDGRLIYIMIRGDKSYLIKRLDKGGTYDKFMDYVLDEDNADIDISLEDIKAERGLGGAENLGLLARYSGFVKPFKRAFFTASGKEKIHFRQTALLDDMQIEAIKKLAEKV